MSTTQNGTPSHRPWKKIIGLSLLIFMSLALVVLYRNFDRLLSNALLRAFDSTLASNVYELKFEKLQVNPFVGNIRVYGVTMQPRETPLQNYPYINSSFRLTTEKLMLENVEIFTLLLDSKLILDQIAITKPDIEVTLAGGRHIMLPFEDSVTLASKTKEKKKRVLASFGLNEFQLINASFHSMNTEMEREFTVRNLNISLYDLLLKQGSGQYAASFSKVALAIGEFDGHTKRDMIRVSSFKEFNLGIDSLSMEMTLDTLTYQFHDFKTGLRAFDIHTIDSTFNISVQSFDLSYLNQSVKLKAVNFKPNVSHAKLQKKFKYQHSDFSGSAGSIELKQVNFDSLIYAKKLFIDEILLDSVRAFIFKDKTKSADASKRPVYLTQAIKTITLPLHIKQITATHVRLENTEKKPDGTLAVIAITKANLEAKNITNISPDSVLLIKADGYINGKARFKAGLTYHYDKPQVEFEGVVEKFNLPDLNPLIQAYTPAKITKGTLDEISFSGMADETSATGTMKFLYHGLEVDLELREAARWKSAVLTFAANTVLNSSNPATAGAPPRVVKFKVKRDMSKGFVNVIIKSIINGLKETMIMSKENRKANRDA